MRQGFTLTEVLASLTIIAIISSILFAVIGPARESGRSTTCLSNERQIAAALMLYMDANSHTPPVVSIDHPWEEAAGLNAVGTQGSLICPDYQPAENASPRGSEWTRTGYAMNDCAHSLSDASDSASTVLVTEVACMTERTETGQDRPLCRDIAEFPDAFFAKPGYHPASGDSEVRPVGQWGSVRHRNRSHYAMVDGHVITLGPDQIAVPKDDKACRLNADQWYGPVHGPTFATIILGDKK